MLFPVVVPVLVFIVAAWSRRALYRLSLSRFGFFEVPHMRDFERFQKTAISTGRCFVVENS
jgi:hypothetical protein